MYRYTPVLFVMNFAGDIDDFTLPLMAWLWHNQTDLLLNPEKNRNIKFTTLINNDDTADILLKCRCAAREGHSGCKRYSSRGAFVGTETAHPVSGRRLERHL